MHQIDSPRNGTYYAIYHTTPQSYTLRQKYPSRHRGYNDFRATAHNIEAVEAYVATIKAKIDLKLKAKQDRLAENAKAREEFVNPYKVGDILYGSWGYDQTNIDFYQVVEVKNRSLKIQKIGYKSVRSTSWCSEEVAPVKDKFVKDEIHRVNLVVRSYNGKIDHSIKSPSFGHLHRHEGGTHHSSWGH
ncbi:MAG: hypothetical protein EBT82_03865 [Micrococcales bacterium]|nr:hypothetical protein [Micrococcales bacterium]